ncbi:30S ribosomal protein S17 [Patescibacteria group bacterium]|nr:30S ribosomal protein S17 [Patescibacteria group bacterium]
MTKQSTTKKAVKIRTLVGVVVSDKNDKTVAVEVQRIKTHPKYGKQYRVSRKYKAHDAKNEYQVSDRVEIKACRPLSKDKRWRVTKKI